MPWTFAHISDIHVGSPRSYRYQPAWKENWETARAQIVEIDPDLLLIGGDLTRDGATHRYELEQVKADLDALPFPYYVIPGNHDIGNKWIAEARESVSQAAVDRYESVFGPGQWSHVHNDVRFSGFNALLAGSGLPAEADMWAWIEAQSAQLLPAHSVWVLHPTFFLERLGEPNWELGTNRLEWIFTVDNPHRQRIVDLLKAAGASLVITSHAHSRHRLDADGLAIQCSPASAFPQSVQQWPDADPALGFLRCEVSDTGIVPEFVPLDRVSDAEGYGPGGSPSMAERDYSIAWERPSLLDLGQVSE